MPSRTTQPTIHGDHRPLVEDGDSRNPPSTGDHPSADAIIAGYSFDRPNDVRTRAYRAMNVGFGLSYTLPVLTALLAPKGSMCLIENPEAHLHPRGQTKLAELAVRASLAGVRLSSRRIATTSWDGIRIAVRDWLIAPEQIAFHYFERQDGKSVVTSPSLMRMAAFPRGLPASSISTKRIWPASSRRSPDMREMVLNHASLRVGQRQRNEIPGWLVGLAQAWLNLSSGALFGPPSGWRVPRTRSTVWKVIRFLTHMPISAMAVTGRNFCSSSD